MRHAPFILLLALAGCAAASPARIGNDALGNRLTPEQEECRSEARRSPEVRAVMREVNPTPNSANEARIREERRLAETAAWRRCLRERGLAQPGGVEVIRGL